MDDDTVEIRRGTAMAAPPIGPYRVLQYLGGGTMGLVYKAEDTRLQRTVALKLLPPELTRDPDAKERFLQEARAASSLDHPNICTIYEAGETSDGRLYLAMACYEGGNLKQRLQNGPLPVAKAIEIAAQVARGLACAHASGIVHRDIKPANVMLTSRGEAKIVDFGLAKLAGQAGVTQAGSLLGTPAYMSPEQAEGEPLDPRTDLWSLGVLLYELVTGRRPFPGEDNRSVIHALLHREPTPISALRPEVPAELERILAGCLAKKPADRYPSAEILAADLEALGAPLRTGSYVPWSPPVRPEPGRRRWRFAVLGLTVLAAAAATFAFWQSRARPGPEPLGAVAEDGRKLLAVLPFENLGAPEDAYFADGITEEITSRLAAIQGLGVISRTSAKQYAGKRKSVREIGRELGVDYVLEGTVRWEREAAEANRVRVTPQLIRVSDDIHLWSESYDREIGEVFKVQSEIAEEVAARLDVALLLRERASLRIRPTVEPAAYQAYLQGKSDLQELIPASEEQGFRAIAKLEEAVRLDPGFAIAHAWLSRAHSSVYQAGYDQTPDRLARAWEAVERALQLQPDLPEAHLALAYYHYWGHRAYEPALRELEIVGRAWPNSTEVQEAIGYIRRRQGQMGEALARFKRAFALDPRNPSLITNIGTTYAMLRRYDLAERHFDLVLSLDPSLSFPQVEKVTNVRLWKGDPALSRELLENVPKSDSIVMAVTWIEQLIYERDFAEALRRIEALPVDMVRNQEQVYPKVLIEAQVRRLQGEEPLARAAYRAAARRLEAEVEKHPRDARLHSSLGLALAGMGQRAEAIAEGKLAADLLPISTDALGGAKRLTDLAEIYTLLGEREAAVDLLERLLAMPCALSGPLLALEPRWDPLRGSPRFQALARRPRAPERGGKS